MAATIASIMLSGLIPFASAVSPSVWPLANPSFTDTGSNPTSRSTSPIKAPLLGPRLRWLVSFSLVVESSWLTSDSSDGESS